MYSNILVPLDGSELGEKALDTAKGLASAFGATVHLMQVVSRRAEFEARQGSGGTVQTAEIEMQLARQLVETQLGRAKEYLEGVATGFQSQGINVVTSIGEGAVDEQIVEYTNANDVDLIVMSTHGHGGIKRLILGSATDRVIRSTKTPVLVIPSS